MGGEQRKKKRKSIGMRNREKRGEEKNSKRAKSKRRKWETKAESWEYIKRN